MNQLTPYEDRESLTTRPADPLPLRGFGPPAEEFDLRQMMGILRRRGSLVLSLTGVVLMGAGVLIYRDVPRYRATAVIRLTDERGEMTGGLGEAAREMLAPTDDPLLSQIEVIRTRTVAGGVVDRLGLRLRPGDGASAAVRLEDVLVDATAPTDTFTVRMDANSYRVEGGPVSARASYGEAVAIGGVRFAIPGPSEPENATLIVRSREEMVDSLERDLRARPRERTDVVDVEFTSTDPALAQRVANAVVEEFQALDARRAQEQSRRRRVFLEEQLTEMDSLHSAAQEELSDFRRQQQVFSSRERYIAGQAGLEGLEVRREELLAEREMFASLLDALSRREDGTAGLLLFASSPGVADNPVMGALFTQLLGFEASRDSLTLGDHRRASTDPEVQQLTGLIAVTREKLGDALIGHVGSLDARVAALDGLRDRGREAMQTLPDAEAEEARYVQKVETVRRLTDELRVEYQKARIAEAVQGAQVEVLDHATLPIEPIPARRPFKLALGLLVGLMAASGAALLLEQMNTAIRAPEELEGTLRVPGLAVIPRVMPNAPARLRMTGRTAAGTDEKVGELITLTDAQSTGAEAYRQLRTNLIFAQALQQLHRILVTSASPGEGKSTVMANLGVTFANQGMRVLLVDADLRRPTLHRMFAVPQTPGLAQVVLGQEELADTIRPTGLENLFLLPAGTLPPNPAELLGQEKVRSLLAQLSQEFDLVLIDSSPATAAADAVILSTMVDGVLMVVRAGATDREVAHHAIQQIRSVGGKIVGAVLNDPDAKLREYGHRYAYHYQDSA